MRALQLNDLTVLVADVPILACAAHGGNVDSAEIEAGFENTVSTLGDLADHDAALAAHDANIDADLVTHDADIKARLDTVDAKLDGLQIVDLTVTALGESDDDDDDDSDDDGRMERFLLAANESGQPVDITLLGVAVSNGRVGQNPISFQDVPAEVTLTGSTGLLDVALDLPHDLRRAKIFQFRVKDAHFDGGGNLIIEHFGTATFHRTADDD